MCGSQDDAKGSWAYVRYLGLVSGHYDDDCMPVNVFQDRLDIINPASEVALHPLLDLNLFPFHDQPLYKRLFVCDTGLQYHEVIEHKTATTYFSGDTLTPISIFARVRHDRLVCATSRDLRAADENNQSV
jgi:hypothetical protein